MPRQTNFSAGELSPLLHSRTDLPLFSKGLRTCLNFFITKHGAAMSRPGTTFVRATKNTPTTVSLFAESGPSAPKNLPTMGYDPVRLIPFTAADDESFVLEFGQGYIRFHTLGATVLKPDTTPYEVVTPYKMSDLPLLKYAQVGEVLTICSPGWDPYELRHLGDAPPSWSFTAAVTAPLAPSFFVPSVNANVAIDMALDRATLPVADPDHPAREWLWRVTVTLKRKSDGAQFESLAQALVNSWDSGGASYAATVRPVTEAVPNNFIAIFPDRPVTLNIVELPPVSAFDYSDYELVEFNVYRGRGTLFGIIGTTASQKFLDVGDAPNYAEQPPMGRSPFGLVEAPGVFVDSSGTNTDRHAQRAAAVGYFQQRRAFGGLHAAAREQDLEISQLGDFDNFDKHNLIDVSGEALQVTLAARRRSVIRHLVGLGRLLILGSANSHHGGGTPQLPLDYNAQDFALIEEVGAADVVPLVVDGVCLFVRALGYGARALVPSQTGYGFTGIDISWMAEHLFRGLERNIVDWAYAEEPWSTCWAVRTDGQLVSLTMDLQQQMVAWARHSLGDAITAADDGPANGAFVQAVCSVREGDEDAVYMVVVRTGRDATDTPYAKRQLERMTSRRIRGGALLGEPSRYGAPTGVLVPPDNICLDCAIPYVGNAAQTFTGLGVHEGKNVYILAQGSPPEGPLKVVNGQVTAAAQYAPNVVGGGGVQKLVLYIGLKFDCELELLDIAGGEARTKMKQVTHVGFEVDQAKGISCGQDAEHTELQDPREVADNYGAAPLVTDIFYLPVPGTWDRKARAVLTQTEPLPVTVIGISRKLADGSSD